MLYNLVQCPERVALDLFGDSSAMEPVSNFVELLWEKGQLFERETIRALSIPFTDLKASPDEERERLTSEAMARGEPLIYGGRIVVDDLTGEPDLLRKQSVGYVAGDIKSGAAEEGGTDETDGKPKKHYAVQLAFYTDILERLGLSGGRTPFVWDVHGREVLYDLDAPQGIRNPTTLWATYEESLAAARAIASKSAATLPALASICKLCRWRTNCISRLEASDDLTLIPELGRAKRDAMVVHVPTVKDLATADIAALTRGKKTVISGVGPDSLVKFQIRARLQTQPGARPYLTEPLTFPSTDLELFFDIENDPFRDICYLHGFVERRGANPGTERYLAFFAERPTPEDEERAFAEAWGFLQASQPCAIYHYSHHERTVWRKLQKLYPRVASEEDLESLFAAQATVDLYTDVVRSKVMWPTRDHSIKTIATHLGFAWRDKEPSGAASIEWYHRWVETRAEEIRDRILQYNEDDCKAMRVLLDALRNMSSVK